MRAGIAVIVLLFAASVEAELRTAERYPAVKFGEAPLNAVPLFRQPRMYPLPWTKPSSPRINPAGSLPEWPVVPNGGLTPAPLASFAAITNGVSLPPDVAGAVGPSHLMATHNGAFQVQTKTGAVIAAMTDRAFWSVIPLHWHYYDPRVIYDHFAGRWVIVEAQKDDTGAGLAFAVSRTGDPSGIWDIYYWPLSGSGMYDYPQLGLNQKTLVISVLAGLDSGNRREVFLIDKSMLYSGRPLATVVFGPPHSSLTPVTSFDGGDANYLLDSASGALVHLYRATLEGVVFVATMTSPAPWSDASTGAPQLGSNEDISTNDTRVTNAILRNGNLWFVHTCFLPAAQPTRSSIQWWRTSTSGQLLDGGRIDDRSDEMFYAFPSIAVNKQNDVVIGFAQFSRRTYASAAYAFRSAHDPPGTIRAPLVMKAGEGTYTPWVRRWGDYSTTVTDPDELTFWTIQEYAAARLGTDGRWGTWWAHLPAGDPLCSVADHRLCLAGNRFAVGVRWDTGTQSGVGHAVLLTSDSGYFWFFDDDNVEVVVKVLDACSQNQRFWVFAAGLTNVHLFVDIKDVKSGRLHSYENPSGVAFQPIQDTTTFDVCP